MGLLSSMLFLVLGVGVIVVMGTCHGVLLGSDVGHALLGTPGLLSHMMVGPRCLCDPTRC